MVYIEYFITFAFAFIVAFCSTPIAKRIAFKLGAIDIPKDDRRMHKKPIALMGGLAIIAGFVMSLLFSVIGMSLDLTGIDGIFPSLKQFLGFAAGILIIIAEGVIDDVKTIGSKTKLAFQIAAAVSVAATGTRIEAITNPFSTSGVSELAPYLSYPITIIWIIGITNAVNLIDGLDGLAAGVSSISSLSLFFVSIIWGRWDVAIVTAALAGATLGFLPFNFNPAKIFMGETGAAFLGFTLGVISIPGTLKSFTAIAVAVPLLVLGVPLFDTAFAIFRRVLNGKPIMEADRGHLHHRLIDMGLSHKQSVVVIYILGAVLGLCAIVLTDRGVLSAIILILSVSVFIIGGAKYMTDIDDSKNYNENNTKDNVNDVVTKRTD